MTDSATLIFEASDNYRALQSLANEYQRKASESGLTPYSASPDPLEGIRPALVDLLNNQRPQDLEENRENAEKLLTEAQRAIEIDDVKKTICSTFDQLGKDSLAISPVLIPALTQLAIAGIISANPLFISVATALLIRLGVAAFCQSYISA